ncbi:GEVED domain-containing protein [Planctomycetes bacterium CA13]|uniref:GEVED domain-containing protein n=1 Tax=Novipirellula herctigrandis TaxID=2527986 RepID=UPI0011B5EAA8
MRRRGLRCENLEQRRLLVASVIEHDGIGHIFWDSVAQVERFDIDTEQWLSPISLQDAPGQLPTTGHVDGDGIYVAYDKSVYRYDLDGRNSTHLINTQQAVRAVHTDGNILIVNHSAGLYTKATSIDKTTFTVIDTIDDYLDTIYGSSISATHNRIFGRTGGIGPSDISYLDYSDDGKFGTNGDSPYHGDYPGGSKTWVFPDEHAVVDDSGTVYSTDSLTRLNSFGTGIDAIDFWEDNVPLVLSGQKITAFSNALLPTGSKTLSYEPDFFFVNDTNVLTFEFSVSSNHGFEVDRFSISELSPASPGNEVDPVGLPFTPDKIELASDGTVLIFSQAHRSLFRWDPISESYTDSIALVGVPEYMAYSATNNAAYLAYQSGLIRQIRFDDDSPEETPFVTLPSSPLGLATAGEYLFAVDPSGAWVSHYTYSADGTLIDDKDWNRSSREFVWSEPNRKIYHFRDGTSPNDLHSEVIELDGSIGAQSETPLHGGPFQYPIRVAPDGSIVVLGSGAIFNAETLNQLPYSLSNQISDAAWIDGQLVTLRNVAGVSELQKWALLTYANVEKIQSDQQGHALLAVREDRLLSISTDESGIPIFQIYDSDLLPASVIDDGQVLPRVIWEPPENIYYGDSLTENQLNANSEVAGEFTYSPELGSVLTAGIGQQLSVVFKPHDTEMYRTVRMSVSIDVIGLDYGDAPVGSVSGFASDYPTLAADDGARHGIGDLYLGESVDADLNGFTDTWANGDALDDGVSLLTSIIALPDHPSSSSLNIVASDAGVVDAWLDMNRDGDWNDEGEQILVNFQVAAGPQVATFDLPAGTVAGSTALRVRLSSAGNLQPTGFANDGEVEDYRILIQDPTEEFVLDASLIASNIGINRVGDVLQFSSEDTVLASVPAWVFSIVDVDGTERDDVFEVETDAEGEIVVRGDGGEGYDTLVVSGTGALLNLHSLPAGELTGIEQIDIRGTGSNLLNLSVEAVKSVTDDANLLTVIHDGHDEVVFGDGWTVQPPTMIGEATHHVLTGDNGAELRISNPDVLTNPLNAFDVNRSGGVSALDALLIINWLNIARDNFSDKSLGSSANDMYLDTSKDLVVSALDAMRVINQLAVQRQAGEEVFETESPPQTSLGAGVERNGWTTIGSPALGVTRASATTVWSSPRVSRVDDALSDENLLRDLHLLF